METPRKIRVKSSHGPAPAPTESTEFWTMDSLVYRPDGEVTEEMREKLTDAFIVMCHENGWEFACGGCNLLDKDKQKAEMALQEVHLILGTPYMDLADELYDRAHPPEPSDGE